MGGSKKPFCITFAGTPGSQKSPVANYLSHSIGLPVFEHDAIRHELEAELLQPEAPHDEYIRRRNERQRRLLEAGRSFIYDASIDRGWPRLKPLLKERGYDWFIIDMHISREFSEKLQRNHGKELPDDADRWFSEHDDFHRRHDDEVGLRINDDNFGQRMDLALNAVRRWRSTVE